MGAFIAGILIFIAFIVLIRHRKRKRTQHREQLIDSYRFPDRISEKLKQSYPHLTDENIAQVIQGLREYFHICNMAGKRRMVAMPSQVVDLAWHEFILFTRHYELFCKQALGRFLHHTPAEAMQSPTQAQDGIKRAWRLACTREGINPESPARLPLLFALDANLGIKDGFTYVLNCKKLADNGYCASHIGCGGGCSGGCGGDSDSGCSGGGCGGD
ncbi:hypothetical protein [Neptuniibacter sp.]|uniref:glycine-rich domain-containing protein n=1 Tax=Neptuniibacter sp. TaxID=1962643 RepID=UPI0026390BCB|nr:hypothetical protein [Neptuniibacter sp.]MCP4598908.1 hypothetical protein [Neptuniibacter sp.]